MRGHAVVVTDDQGRITLWSDEAEEIFGHRRDDVVGGSLDILIPEQYRSYHWNAFHISMATAEFHYDDVVVCDPMIHADGSVHPHRGRFSLLLSETGQPIGTVATWAPSLPEDADDPGPRVVSGGRRQPDS